MTGRQRRRQHEYEQLLRCTEGREDIVLTVTARDADGIPYAYSVDYHIKSICGIDDNKAPVFANHFTMAIDIPEDYPQVDAPPVFRFITQHPTPITQHPSPNTQHPSPNTHHPTPNTQHPSPNTQHPTPLPWHPNIRYHGDMAGHVCINAISTFTDIAWGVERIALYLRYELYHAMPEPPYPEDLTVAEWVRHIGEPNDYIFFDQ